MKPSKQRKSTKKLGKPGTVKKSGLPAGSLIHVGKIKTEKTRIDVIEYNATSLIEKNQLGIKEASAYIDTSEPTWLRVTGLQDTQLIGDLGKAYGLHPLLIEDILNTGQRPKVELMKDYVFFTTKTLEISPDNGVISDQVSLILRKNLIISFHESDLEFLAPLYERINLEESRIRNNGVDYLFYALIDIIVDNYFNVIEVVAEMIDNVEDQIFSSPEENVLDTVQQIRKELLFLKKTIFPIREGLSTLIRTDIPLIDPQQVKYLGDVYDHVIHIYETIETYRELNTGLKEVYLSALSNKMNEVMKTLTIIATIFIPLTFVVGIYGMNFKNMPEISWKYGYLSVWIVMIAISLFMLFHFKKRKWI
ncbi:MAG: magnesium and cobalt transport protein CorA [Bacteroidetes bacterium HGW-Bacteroidetes-1]|jgi:magnesium transporter|nr:MAG: magnesium and cobalt transport protein CorA [Bacteroidetes bacterium HGW-Bacteroidetes-1]